MQLFKIKFCRKVCPSFMLCQYELVTWHILNILFDFLNIKTSN